MSAAHTFHQLLAELELLSHGSTTAWNPSTGGDGDNPLPKGDTYPPHIEFRARWQSTESIEADHRRESVQANLVAEAREVLNRWRGHYERPQPATELDTQRLILTDGVGWDAELVAQRFRCSVTLVRRWRGQSGCDPQDGKPLEVKAERRKDRVRELAARGLSTRQIAPLVGVSHTRVAEYLREG